MADAGDMISRDRADLITCIVCREGGVWDVTWASDGSTPDDYSDDDLAAVIDRAEAGVADLYGDKPDISSDVLQYAIYPWELKTSDNFVMLDIKGGPGGYTARDIQGSDAYVQGSSLEELVLEAERHLPNTQDAMFRWIVPISELFEADSDAGEIDTLETVVAVGRTLVPSGIAVTAADIDAIMSVRAELTGGDREASPAERADAIAHVANATGRRPDVVARIYDEVERYLSIRRSGE